MRPFKTLEFRAMNGPILDAAEFSGPPDQRVCCSRKLLAGLGHTNGGVPGYFTNTPQLEHHQKNPTVYVASNNRYL